MVAPFFKKNKKHEHMDLIIKDLSTKSTYIMKLKTYKEIAIEGGFHVTIGIVIICISFLTYLIAQ